MSSSKAGGTRPPWSSSNHSYAGLPVQRRGSRGEQPPFSARKGLDKQQEPQGKKYLGGFITADDLESPFRVVVKLSVLVMFSPLIVAKVCFDVAVALLQSFLQQLPWLISSGIEHIVLPCWRLFCRMAAAYLRFVNEYIIQPCVRAARSFLSWCYSTLIPFLARTACNIIESAARLVYRLANLWLSFMQKYVIPSLQWLGSRAWAIIKGIGPAIMAAIRGAIRQVNRLVIQPALGATAAIYRVMRHRVVPWVWATVCKIAPAILATFKAISQEVHRLFIQPALEATGVAYRYLRFKLLPWVWTTASTVVPNTVAFCHSLVSSLWNSVVVPVYQDLWNLWTWGWNEVARPMLGLVHHVKEGIGAITAPVLALAKEVSASLLHTASAAITWGLQAAGDLRVWLTGLTSEVLAAAFSLLSTLKSTTTDVLLLVKEVAAAILDIVFGGDSSSTPTPADPEPLVVPPQPQGVGMVKQ